MLSSSQLECIEEAIGLGRVVLDDGNRVHSVVRVPESVGYLELVCGFRRSIAFVRAEDVVIGDRLEVLRPR